MAKLTATQEEIIYQMKNYFDNDDANSICLADLSDVMQMEEDVLKEEIDILLDKNVLGYNDNPVSVEVFYIL